MQDSLPRTAATEPRLEPLLLLMFRESGPVLLKAGTTGSDCLLFMLRLEVRESRPSLGRPLRLPTSDLTCCSSSLKISLMF